MIEILQGETLTFALTGEDLSNYEVRAALRPSDKSYRRDCVCGESVTSWDNINIVDGAAEWTLTTEQSADLPAGKYAVEVALRDADTQQDIKESTVDVIKVKQSYTR